MLTLFEVTRVLWGVDLTSFIQESGYSRSHVARVRSGKIEPSRDFIAKSVSAFRHLTLRDVRAEEIFELVAETSGAWPRRTADQLRESARGWKREKKANAQLIARLRASPPDQWQSLLLAPSSDVVRALLYEARSVFDRIPEHAEHLASAALAMAKTLADVRGPYRKALVANAALEHANALRQQGKLPAALEAVNVATDAAEGEAECTHILARAWLARGTILFKSGDLPAAEEWLRRTINLFAAIDDQRRLAKVRMVQGGVLFERGAVAEARDTWLACEPALAASRDIHALSVVRLNLGWCETELGNIVVARRWAIQAREGFESIHSEVEELRARWCEARLDALFVSPDDGVRRLANIRNAFETRGITQDAAMVGLDIVETLLLPPVRAALAVQVLKQAIPHLIRGGASRETQKAMAYLQSAAEAHDLQRADVQACATTSKMFTVTRTHASTGRGERGKPDEGRRRAPPSSSQTASRDRNRDAAFQHEQRQGDDDREHRQTSS